MVMDKQGKPRFFKVLLRDDVDYLLLPTVFSKKYLEGKISREVVLQIGSRKWKMEYYNIDDKYCFIRGWLKFMKDNNVKQNDFLVFRLRYPSTFKVYLFGPDGSLKDSTSSDEDHEDDDTPRKRIKTEEAIEIKISDDDGSAEEDQFSFVRTVGKSHITYLPITTSYARESGIGDKYDKVRLKNDKGKTWPVAITRRFREHTLCMTIGWKEFREENNIEEEDICGFRNIRDNLFEVEVKKKKKNKRGRGRPCKNKSPS